MADKKISALTGATTPLAGTEVLPIVQSGATVKVAVSDLTAGRAVSATQLTSTVAIGTAPLVVTSTTNVANLNASSLNGATFAAPGAIGGGTASAGSFTTLGATGVVTQTGANPSYYAKANNSGIGSYYFTNAAGTDYWRIYSAMGAAGEQNNFAIRDVAGGNNILTLASTGAAVIGNITPSTAAKGINFTANTPAAGMTSQLFNWYEEGTFTAGIAFGGAAVGVTYDTTPTCAYTKIGRQVTVTGRVGLTSKGSSTGNATITGLPFTSANTGNAGYGATSIAMNLVTFANQYVSYIVPNSTSLSLYENTILGVQSAITDADFGSASNLLFTATYFV